MQPLKQHRRFGHSSTQYLDLLIRQMQERTYERYSDMVWNIIRHCLQWDLNQQPNAGDLRSVILPLLNAYV